jgi:hypothetical protein
MSIQPKQHGAGLTPKALKTNRRQRNRANRGTELAIILAIARGIWQQKYEGGIAR